MRSAHKTTLAVPTFHCQWDRGVTDGVKVRHTFLSPCEHDTLFSQERTMKCYFAHECPFGLVPLTNRLMTRGRMERILL